MRQTVTIRFTVLLGLDLGTDSRAQGWGWMKFAPLINKLIEILAPLAIFGVDWLEAKFTIHSMIGLLRKLFWIALFLIFTVVFVTLFEHGWTNTGAFIKDFKTEVDNAKSLIPQKPEPKTDKNSLH